LMGALDQNFAITGYQYRGRLKSSHKSCEPA
jgi:hypothetical protein